VLHNCIVSKDIWMDMLLVFLDEKVSSLNT
jgi:hypothetical protein